MKIKYLFLGVCVSVLLASCKDQFDEIEKNDTSEGKRMSSSDLVKLRSKIETDSLKRFPVDFAYMNTSDFSRVFGGANVVAAPMAWTMFGPYTQSGTLTKLETNKKIAIPFGIPPSHGPGIYFVDVWKNEWTVTLQDTDAFMFLGTNQVGYKAYYDGTFYEDYTLEEINNPGPTKTYKCWTHSYVLKYNAGGYPVPGVVIPRDLTPTTYSYQYLRDI